MKVGSLVWALSLILALPSATVLALTGSIDRTMQTGAVLLLLVSLHSVSSTESTVDECRDNTMVCFAPKACVSGSDQATDKFAAETVADTCKFIIKMRPYSARMYRVVLESRDPGVNEITVRREGIPLFSCKAGSAPQYKGTGNEITLFERKDNPLKCEFIAKDKNTDIFQSSYANIETKTNLGTGGTPSVIRERDIHSKISESMFCNPADATFDAHNPGPYSVERVTIGLKDLTCPAPYQLETRLLNKAESLMEPEFIKTTSIECKSGYQSNVKHKFTIVREHFADITVQPSETFNYRCAAITCSLCDVIPPGGVSIVNAAEGCKELKCASGRLKVGESVGDVATCKKIEGKATWDLNGTAIEKTTAVTCVTKFECPDARTMCNADDKCAVDSTSGLPKCTSGKLTYNSKQVAVSCDYTTGKWMYAEGGPGMQLPDGSTLICVDPNPCMLTTILSIAFGGIILVSLVIGLGICLYRRRKERQEKEKKLRLAEKLESKAAEGCVPYQSTLADFPGDEGFGATVGDPAKTPARKESKEKAKGQAKEGFAPYQSTLADFPGDEGFGATVGVSQTAVVK